MAAAIRRAGPVTFCAVKLASLVTRTRSIEIWISAEMARTTAANVRYGITVVTNCEMRIADYPTGAPLFGDTVVAAAVLDRLMHNAIVFNIKGPGVLNVNTTASRSPPPNPTNGGRANLTNRRSKHRPHVGFR